MKHELVEWLYIDLALAWFEPKLNFLFAKISFGVKVKGHGNPICLKSSQQWL